ncbi:unnamed protein product [Hydatigera taeniaeformis]|uniref:Armadillo repeat-containing protein n=1 Tax=Hydatigena taeniaeformis TaxID=6205 RepID=A0A0R3X583_HYDTA|nr:unnamed protein product [Hydatigera taeniaeformis]
MKPHHYQECGSNLPPTSVGCVDLASLSSPSAHSAHFYLGSSSGGGACDHLLTELEINSKMNGSSQAQFSVGEPIDPIIKRPGSNRDFRDEDLKHALDLLSRDDSGDVASAAAYLCHLSYQNPEVKRKVADFGGIESFSRLLLSSIQIVKKCAVSALRNLSYECTPEIRNRMDDSSVISNLFVLLNELMDEDVSPSQLSMNLNQSTVEAATATLCNLSIYPEFKDTISRNGVPCLIKNIILPYSGIARDVNTSTKNERSAETYELPTFIYATGTIRNVLVEDAECRHRLRESLGFVAALSLVCSHCVENYAFDGKALENCALENCVCILRNLSFALQEVRDPAYLVRRETAYSVAAITPIAENRLAFKHPHLALKGHQRGIVMNLRKTPSANIWMGGGPDYLDRPPSNLESIQGSRLLWAKDLIENYISILRHSTNLVILEATAGAIQNLTACDWEPSAEVRSFVRQLILPNFFYAKRFLKDNFVSTCLVKFRTGDNVLVLAAPLISEDDSVVLTTATALRNVAEEESLRSLVAFYGMRLLIARLPVLQAASTIDGEIVVPTHSIVSLHTASAILAALYVLVKADSERALLFLDCGGVQPCLAIAHTGLYVDPTDPIPSNRDKTVRFARFLLQTLWAQRDLQDRFKKAGLRATDFCVHEPIIRETLKHSLTTVVRPSLDTPKRADKEDCGSPRKEAKLQGEDESHLHSVVQNSLPPAEYIIAIVSFTWWLHYLLQPPSIAPQPSLHPTSRRMSRLSVVPEASLRSTPPSRSSLSKNVPVSPQKKGYFSQLNVPEIIAVHPSPRRELQIERSVSPFLRPSASNVDIKSLSSAKSQNQLYLGQQGLQGPLSKSSNSGIHYSSSAFGVQHLQEWCSEVGRSPSQMTHSDALSSEE